jgi:putative transposase
LEKRYPFVMVDAMYVKVRELGRVRSKALLIAMGVNEEGYREVLGFTLWDSEPI